MALKPTGVTAPQVIAADIRYLRRLIDDRVVNAVNQAIHFTDAELEDIITRTDWDLYRAASECWGIKAGEYAKMIDLQESGSSRQLSKLFDQAIAQSDYYMNKSLMEMEQKISIAPRIVSLTRVANDTDAYNGGLTYPNPPLPSW